VSLEAAIDNDVLIKTACYSLFDEVIAVFDGCASIGILGAARFVVGNRLRRGKGIRDPESAQSAFAAFVDCVNQLEPTAVEVELATAIEEAAMLEGLPLDTGESQLCAMVLRRSIRLLVTGDKRAIGSLEKVMPKIVGLTALQSRVGCLEQLLLKIVERIGRSVCRSHICSEPDVDKALTICFSCGRETSTDSSLDGLRSYINDLRRTAPTVLLGADTLD
jgi:hypothetical protein